jgi:hypothetical protein
MDDLYCIAVTKQDLDRLFVVLDFTLPIVGPEDKPHIAGLRSLVMRADKESSTAG